MRTIWSSKARTFSITPDAYAMTTAFTESEAVSWGFFDFVTGYVNENPPLPEYIPAFILISKKKKKTSVFQV